MKKLLFIYNSNSGKAQIKNHLADIIDIFVKAEYEVTAHPTQKKADTYEQIAQNGENYDLVVTSGGDGTLNEAVSGLMLLDKKPEFGYIPSGTTNDYASSLGISKNMLTAAETIVSGNTFNCDVGSFNDRYFAYIAAFGAFTEVAYQTPQQKKNILGHLAYVLEGIKSLKSIENYHLQIEINSTVIEDDFIFGMISNTMSVGGFKGKEELGVKLDDGVFEVALIRMPKNAIELQTTINHLLTFDINSPYIYFGRADKVTFSSEKEIPWTLDGEFGGNVSKVTVKNLNKALQILK